MAIVINGDTGITATGGADLIQDGSITEADLAFTVSSFDSGTVMLFGQTSAPTGWTKDTTNYNNSGLRVVTGTASTGGSVDFTTAFASQSVAGTVGSYTLTTSDIPSHNHSIEANDSGVGTAKAAFTSTGTVVSPTPTTGSTGGGGSHSHSFSGTAINLSVKYVDVIRATKD